MKFFLYVAMPILLLASVALADSSTAPAATEYADTAKTFSLSAPDPWVRDARREGADPSIAMVLARPDAAAGAFSPTILVIKRAVTDLDAVAQALLASAKRRHPDQQGAGTIEKSKVDGDEARTIVYLLEENGHTVQVKTMVVNHAGSNYFFQFLCEQSDFKTRSADGDNILGTIRWSR